jgi:hypothetical protein
VVAAAADPFIIQNTELVMHLRAKEQFRSMVSSLSDFEARLFVIDGVSLVIN